MTGESDEIEYLVWDTSDLPADERDAILEEAIADLDRDVVVLSDDDDLDAIATADADPAWADSPPGPRVGETGDPQLLLIVLESSLIAIETAKLGLKISEKTGLGAIAREKFRERLLAADQQVETGTAESVNEAVDDDAD